MTKIGLALSGGGIRAYSQIPVVQALENEKITLSSVAGTSIGSVVAALVAMGLNKQELLKVMFALELKIKEQGIFSKVSSKVLPFSKERIYGGYIDGKVLEDIFVDLTKEYGMTKMKDVKIPLAIPATDMVTGKVVVFVSHPELFKPGEYADEWIIISDMEIAKAIRYSSSFPFVIASGFVDGHRLIDGGVAMNLPLPLIQAYGADKTIAVTMHMGNHNFQHSDSVYDYSIRIGDIMRLYGDRYYTSIADVHIDIPLDDVNILDIGKGKVALEHGAAATQAKLGELRALKKRRLFGKVNKK